MKTVCNTISKRVHTHKELLKYANNKNANKFHTAENSRQRYLSQFSNKF